MATSPTTLSLKHLREHPDGYTLVAVVEKWNPHMRIRQDLFGIIDIIACGPAGTLAVQATSASNVASRVKKLREHESTRPLLLTPGWRIEVHGWAKVRNRWELVKRKEFVLGDGGGIARTGEASARLAETAAPSACPIAVDAECDHECGARCCWYAAEAVGGCDEHWPTPEVEHRCLDCALGVAPDDGGPA